MTAPKFTPGPCPTMNPRLPYEDYKPLGYMEGDADFVSHNREWLEWCEANARLIAAAPELLEALQAITAAFVHIPDDDKGNKARTAIFAHCENMRKAAVSARLAISKAEGRA